MSDLVKEFKFLLLLWARLFFLLRAIELLSIYKNVNLLFSSGFVLWPRSGSFHGHAVYRKNYNNLQGLLSAGKIDSLFSSSEDFVSGLMGQKRLVSNSAVYAL